MVHKKIFRRAREFSVLQFNNFSGFVKQNPVLSGVIGSGILATLGGIGVVAIRRRRAARRRPVKRRQRIVRRRVSTTRRRHRKGVTHMSPRHKGHKRVSFMSRGKRVSFLVKRKGGRR